MSEKKSIVGIHMDEDLARSIKIIARVEGIPMSTLVSNIVRATIKEKLSSDDYREKVLDQLGAGL
jgi:hypothetical protein